MKLLVIDDEPVILQGIIRMIQKANTPYTEIVGASDGIDALQKLESFEPDLILTDIHMPEMDGLSLIKTVQVQNLCSRFVIITGYDDFAYARQALRYQVVDYLLKPINKQELLAVLQTVEQDIRLEQEQNKAFDLMLLKEHLFYNTPLTEMAMNPEHLRSLCPGPWTTIIVMQAGERTPLLTDEQLAPICAGLAANDMNAYAIHSRYLRQAVLLVNGRHALSANELQQVCGVLLRTEEGGAGYLAGISGTMSDVERLRETYLAAVAGMYTSGSSFDEAGDSEPAEPLQPHTQAIDKIISFVEQNYKQDISLDTVAEHVRMHPNYISMLFRKEMDHTFLHYLHTFRLTKAKQFMQEHPDWPIHTIAELVGYENPRHFFKVFKKFENTTPGQYRLEHAAQG
ncbi:response regulator [Paenibacillus sp. GCM10023248]|uniref:response regulator transcription factor n=1 Tax=unclassified Paenibacillus TaxID=185978 RepID=UPI002379925F|nr:response regulator [Paenibacillus sp. MAHUQ-63]MDD9268209.1 response regulator [Paenibacillus sp. MAHUQ-63]